MPLNVLIASYLERGHIERIREAVPQVDVIYRPDLIGAPLYHAHHTAVIDRTTAQEAEWREMLACADILFDFSITPIAKTCRSLRPISNGSRRPAPASCAESTSCAPKPAKQQPEQRPNKTRTKDQSAINSAYFSRLPCTPLTTLPIKP